MILQLFNVVVMINVMQVFAMVLRSGQKGSRSPVIEGTVMDGENSHSEMDIWDSNYEEEEDGSENSSSSVCLEEEGSTSSSGKLGGEMRSKKRDDRGGTRGEDARGWEKGRCRTRWKGSGG